MVACTLAARPGTCIATISAVTEPVPGSRPSRAPLSVLAPLSSLSLGQYLCSLSGAQPEIWSVGSSWLPPVHRMACRLFVASLQSTSFVVSPADPEGEGAPRSSGPVHLGRSARPKAATCHLSSKFVLVLSHWHTGRPASGCRRDACEAMRASFAHSGWQPEHVPA